MKYFDYPKLTGHIVHIKLEQNADGNEYYNLLVTPTNSGIQDADIRLFKNTDGTVQMSNQFALAGKGEFSKFNEILGPEYYEFLGPGRNKVHPIIFKKVSD
ncbi:MAG: hypothetical protein FWG17_06765 [Desulfovibrionaceae bacterium]|nr:hypothetical protein [Desulfovibrionaceae bacterium]